MSKTIGKFLSSTSRFVFLTNIPIVRPVLYQKIVQYPYFFILLYESIAMRISEV